MVQSSDPLTSLKENYVAAAFQGEAPPPLSKVKEPLPWEQLAETVGDIQEELHDKREEAVDKKVDLQEQGTIGSIVGTATEVITRLGTTVGRGLHKLALEATEKLEEAQKVRMQERFPVLEGETLLYEYSCYGFSDRTPCSGFFYITTHHIGFYSDTGPKRVKVWFPIEKVVSIRRGITQTELLKTTSIKLLESEEDTADSILIYTDDHEVHKFYKFGILPDPITNYFAHAWNVLDHAWRDSKEVLKESKLGWNKDPWEKKVQEEGGAEHFDTDDTRDFEGDMKKDFSRAYAKQEVQKQKDAEVPIVEEQKIS